MRACNVYLRGVYTGQHHYLEVIPEGMDGESFVSALVGLLACQLRERERERLTQCRLERERMLT